MLVVLVPSGTHALEPGTTVAEAGEALVAPNAGSRVRWRLQRAYVIATARLQESPSCRALFSDLGRDGMEVLSLTLYRGPDSPEETRTCGDRSAAAFTEVGGRLTVLCPDTFQLLPTHRAAVLLLHEALHHAGMPEAPQTAGALTSHQITLLVRRACGL